MKLKFNCGVCDNIHEDEMLTVGDLRPIIKNLADDVLIAFETDEGWEYPMSVNSGTCQKMKRVPSGEPMRALMFCRLEMVKQKEADA